VRARRRELPRHLPQALHQHLAVRLGLLRRLLRVGHLPVHGRLGVEQLPLERVDALLLLRQRVGLLARVARAVLGVAVRRRELGLELLHLRAERMGGMST